MTQNKPKRPRPGRPPLNGSKKSVVLNPHHWDKAKRLGKGKYAVGIRAALDNVEDVK